MESNYFLSIVLDTRNQKKNGKYPVKLRLFTSIPRKQKLYNTTFDFTKEEFKKAWESRSTSTSFRPFKLKLKALLQKAETVAASMDPFSFEKFERKLFRKKSDVILIAYQYKLAIEEYQKAGKIGTKDSYGQSLNSLKKFYETRRANINNITFFEMTPNLLQDYEQYMVEDLGRSINTVGIYLRNLRAIFNRVLNDGIIKDSDYPFKKGGYTIPVSKGSKKAFSQQELKEFFDGKPATPFQKKAKEFWLLSYLLNGMNFADILRLKPAQLKGDTLTFIREKTKNSTKGKVNSIEVFIHPYAKEVIKKYGEMKNYFIFDIVARGQTPEESKYAVRNFTRFVNQHLKKYCKELKLPVASSVWARHTFATIGIRKGVGLEFMQEALGHQNITTTQNYFAGFDDDAKKHFGKGLLEFD